MSDDTGESGETYDKEHSIRPDWNKDSGSTDTCGDRSPEQRQKMREAMNRFVKEGFTDGEPHMIFMVAFSKCDKVPTRFHISQLFGSTDAADGTLKLTMEHVLHAIRHAEQDMMKSWNAAVIKEWQARQAGYVQ